MRNGIIVVRLKAASDEILSDTLDEIIFALESMKDGTKGLGFDFTTYGPVLDNQSGETYDLFVPIVAPLPPEPIPCTPDGDCCNYAHEPVVRSCMCSCHVEAQVKL